MKEETNITKHSINIFMNGELDKKAMCKKCILLVTKVLPRLFRHQIELSGNSG